MKQSMIELSNNIKIPQFGLGVYQIPDGQPVIDAVKLALSLGYRHIDTAHAYQNEKGVGQAILESKISREKIWVTSKLWPSDYEDIESIDKMLKRLNMDTIDLVLLHQQVGNWKAGWRLLENAYLTGKVRSIGISNFDGERLTDIYNWSKIKPHVVQVEVHPYDQQKELRKFLKIYNTAIEGWFPLGHGDENLLNESIFTILAKKYHKTNAQIILRWHIQEGIIVFPRSTSKEHLAENIDIFDFELLDTEMDSVRMLNKNERYFKFDYEEQKQRFLNWKVNY